MYTSYYAMRGYYGAELYHHGILGQRWGRRNGPPYPLKYESHSKEETKSGWTKSLGANSPSKISNTKKNSSASNSKSNSHNNSTKGSSSGNASADGTESGSTKKGLTKKQKILIAAGATAVVAGLSVYGYYRLRGSGSTYYKRNVDQVLSSGTMLTTLSYDANRTQNADMFFAAHRTLDKHQYNALFNGTLKQMKAEYSGKKQIDNPLKLRIQNKVTSSMTVASENSSAKIFRDMFNNDSDFRDFVLNKDRMESNFDRSRLKFKGYREAMAALNKIRNSDKVSESDLKKVYRMFNYVIPSDGGGDSAKASDMLAQRGKFFNELKNKGYGAVLDVNDALYGGFHATSPVIVFDQAKIVLSSVEQTTLKEKEFSSLVLAGRKILGI